MYSGMNVAAGPELAAAVSNAGGLGVIGGLGYTCVSFTLLVAFAKSHARSPANEIAQSNYEPKSRRSSPVSNHLIFVSYLLSPMKVVRLTSSIRS